MLIKGCFITPHAECKSIRGTFNLMHPVRGAFADARADHFNLMHPMRGATRFPTYYSGAFQSNAPHAGRNSKTIQSKRILVACRMYNFANYVLHTLKHSPTHCIGITL